MTYHFNFIQRGTLAKPSSFHLILPVAGGLAEDGEIESRTLWSGIGEDELVCQRGLPASRGARDNVEREFGEAAAHDFVEARNSSGEFVDLYFVLGAHAFLPCIELRSSKASPGHSFRSRLNVKASPRKIRSRPSKRAMRTIPPSPAGNSPDRSLSMSI